MGLYIVWGLLPFTFVILSIWALLRPLVHSYGKESWWNYGEPALYTSVGLVIAVVLVNIGPPELIADNSFGYLDVRMPRWLMYPAVLTIMITLQSKIRKEDQFKVGQRTFRS